MVYCLRVRLKWQAPCTDVHAIPIVHGRMAPLERLVRTHTTKFSGFPGHKFRVLLKVLTVAVS